MSHWDYSSWCSPCLCGKGTFRVHWESENYPPFRQFFDSKISCPECDQTYYLAVHSLTDVRVSRKCDHAARGAAVTARNAIWNSDRDVLALRVRLRLRLDAMRCQVRRHGIAGCVSTEFTGLSGLFSLGRSGPAGLGRGTDRHDAIGGVPVSRSGQTAMRDCGDPRGANPCTRQARMEKRGSALTAMIDAFTIPYENADPGRVGVLLPARTAPSGRKAASRLALCHDRTPGSRRERLSIAVGSTVQALGGTVRFHPSSRALGLARGDFIDFRWG
jgi:hypothetical protein